MKGYFDKLYELIHKNSLKRRRMFSLLLVLSLFVSTGVLWSLRDIGITIVNDAMCGFDEHTHTEDCYGNVLVCGLEEDEEHTHTEECYETALICGHEEHIHLAACYTDEELPREQEEEPEGIVYINSDEYSEEDMYEESLLSEMGIELPDIEIPAEIQTLDNDVVPGVLSTYDNTLDGIKINFFDYGTEELESGEYKTGNHYDHPLDAGINGVAGFERNMYVQDEQGEDYMNKFLLFFAYGTPATSMIKDGTIRNENIEGGKVNPTINNYSGSWVDDNGKYPAGNVSGNRPVQGIVAPVLGANGYPELANSGFSLGHLFGPFAFDNDAKTFYENVTHLMKKDTDTGRYSFYSDENYAYLDTNTKKFTVYKDTYQIYEGEDKEHNGRPIGFFPFDEYPTQYDSVQQGINVYRDDGNSNYIYGDPTHNTRIGEYGEQRHDYNHHFGMTMEASFQMSGDDHYQFKGQDVEFSYSGDDDMWVFVDDVLILDLGGIHEPAAGQINFTDGYVLVQDNAYGKYMTTDKHNDGNGNDCQGLTQVNSEPVNVCHGINSDLAGNIVSGNVLLNCMRRFSDDNGNTDIARMDYYDLGELYRINSGGRQWIQDDPHTIKIFYLERGGSYSNLAMEFCLPFTKQLSIEKAVDDKSGGNEFDSVNDEGFKFQLFTKEKNDETFHKTDNRHFVYNDGGSGQTDGDGCFYLKKGQRIIIKEASPDLAYYVKELDTNTQIYDNIRIVDTSNEEKSLQDAGNYYDKGQPYYLLGENNYVKFVNHVKYDTVELTVNKEWSNGNQNHNGDKVKFKLYRVEVSGSKKTKTPIAYNNKMTFVLSNDNNWEMKFENLPVEYGNHKYIYEVVEVDIPSGYNASYSDFKQISDGKASLTITNTDISNVEINVKKEWGNVDTEDMSIELVLKRLVSTNVGNPSTNLTINLVDKNGSTLQTEMTNKVYVNGSLEFSVELPDGAEYVSGAVSANSGQPELKKIGEQGQTLYFEVSNLQQSDNTVTIRLDVDNVITGGGGGVASSVEPLIHHSFTDIGAEYGFAGNNNNQYLWKGNGDATLGLSAYDTYASGNALLVSDRNNNYSGARLDLDTAIFSKGKEYTFSVYVKYDDSNGNPANVKFAMTLNDGSDNYIQVASENVTRGAWTQIVGSKKIPDNFNEDKMFLYIETKTDSAKNMNYRMDEFVAVEGNANISVDTNGNVTVTRAGGNNSGGNSGNSSGGKVVHYTDFNGSNTLDKIAWERSGEPTLSSVDDDYGGYIEITNRNQKYDGISLDVGTLLEPGHTYQFNAVVQRDGVDSCNGNEKPHLILTLEQNVLNPDDDAYINVCPQTNWEDQGNTYSFGEMIGTYSAPSDMNWTAKKIYFNIPYGDSDGCEEISFRVRSVKITDITPESAPPAPAVQYNVIIDEDSATNPLHDGDYQPDNNFGENGSIKLELNSGNWTWKLDKSKLNEQSGSRYLYYIAEETIKKGDRIIAVYVIEDNNRAEDGKLKFQEQGEGKEDYEVSFKRNFVATNTSETPITISNKYIWYRLPETGGSGTARIYLLGLGLVSLGATSLFINYRRKRRRV